MMQALEPRLNAQADQSIRVRALLIGSRIDAKAFRADESLAINPLVIAIPGAVVPSYSVMALWYLLV